MIFTVKTTFTFLGKACLIAIWIGAVGSTYALQLGKHRGAAVIGQPLNIAVQATIDSPDELAAGCLDADVFYADNRVEKSRVRISTERSGTSPQDAIIRIRATAVIDEPVVTIYLRTGCSQKIEKRYVVLADVLSESATGGAISTPGLPAQAPASRLAPRSEGSGAASSALASASGTAREARRIEREAQRLEQKNKAAIAKAARGAPLDAKVPSSVEKIPAPAVSAQVPRIEKKPVQTDTQSLAADKPRSRLKLETVELLAERDPTLKPSVELRTVPTNDPAQRSAAAALWRAIAAQPEDILGDSQKLKALESAVSGLQVEMKKNQLDLQNLGGDIEKAQTENYANPLVYGLSFLLFLSALGLAVVLRKRAAGGSDLNIVQPWWRKGSGQRVGWADSSENIQASSSSYAFGLGSVSAQNGNNFEPSAANYLDLDLSDAGGKPSIATGKPGRGEEAFLVSPSSIRRHSVKGQAAQNVRVDFTHSMSSVGRAVKAEELFDVQQQADFFVSLGQKDQAIEVLRSHIEESEETSALVYLDLLKLYHELDERLEFDAFRQEFNAKFNAEMPEFEDYGKAASSAGLQAYPVAMSRIVALWPSAKVLNVLEESMFRQPDSQTATFDLEAYRELLLLYAMIKDILHAQSAGKGPTLIPAPQRASQAKAADFKLSGEQQANTSQKDGSNFPATAVVPLAATPDAHAAKSTYFDVDVDVDVDVDLNSLSKPGSDGASLAELQSNLHAESSTEVRPTSPASLKSDTKKNAASTENGIDFNIDFDQPPNADSAVKKLPSHLPRSNGRGQA